MMATADHLVQTSVPRSLDTVPRPLLALAAMLVLAGLDLLGALLARHWSETHGGAGRLLFFLGGVATFVVLFAVYAKSLQFAELVPVTFGWIAILQVGLLVIAAVGNSRHVSGAQWAAALAMVALEGFLLVSSE
jgi:hypothetical protein